MSAFGGKADIKLCCHESPLITQSGHQLVGADEVDEEDGLHLPQKL